MKAGSVVSHPLQSRRFAAVLTGLLAGFLVLTASPALGLPGGGWSQLDLVYRGKTVGSAYGTWQGYREDQGRGSRVQNWSAHRMPGVPDPSATPARPSAARADGGPTGTPARR